MKKGVLKAMLEFLFDKVSGLSACNFTKKVTQTKLFFCKICEIFKNIYFGEHLGADDSITALFVAVDGLIVDGLIVRALLVKPSIKISKILTRNSAKLFPDDEFEGKFIFSYLS